MARRAVMPVVFSVGYEGRDAPAIVQALVDARVDVLVDVRLTPISRKPGLSKARLGEALASAGISYRHDRALGNPKDNRDAFRGPDVDEARRRFAARLSNGSRGALKELVELARDSRVAVLCVERDPHRCHRSVITEAAQEMSPGIAIIDL
jgi:uncharacterized protein (DUF488 family)